MWGKECVGGFVISVLLSLPASGQDPIPLQGTDTVRWQLTEGVNGIDSAAAATNGRLYFMASDKAFSSGDPCPPRSQSFFEFDPASRRTRQLPSPTSTRRAYGNIVASADGNINFFGGSTVDCPEFVTYSLADQYSPSSGVWSPLASMLTPRHWFAGKAVISEPDGSLLVLGGNDWNAEAKQFNSLVTVDALESDAWVRRGLTLSEPRDFGLSVARTIADDFYLIGRSRRAPFQNVFERLEPDLLSGGGYRWHRLSPPGPELGKLAAGPDGQLYGIGFNGIGTFQQYDAHNNLWRQKAPLPAPHEPLNSDVTFGKNGRLYLFGRTIAEGTLVPRVTASFYMVGRTANVAERAFELGLAQGHNHQQAPGVQNEVVILSFGDPAVRVGNDGLERFGATMYVGWAEPLFIESVVEHFAAGYYAGQDDGSKITLVVGVTNHGRRVTLQHGAAWAELVERANAWLYANGFSSSVDVAAGIDAEPSYNSYTTTRPWIEGYHLTGRAPLYFYGSADGCPLDAIGQCCPGDAACWSQEQLLEVAWQWPLMKTIPQIYTESGTQARQWAFLASLASENPRDKGPLVLSGVLTTAVGCQQQSCTTAIRNLPAQGWDQLEQAVNLNNATSHYPAALTDIQWLPDSR